MVGSVVWVVLDVFLRLWYARDMIEFRRHNDGQNIQVRNVHWGNAQYLVVDRDVFRGYLRVLIDLGIPRKNMDLPEHSENHSAMPLR